MFSLFLAWMNGWVNNSDAGDLRRCRAHYDVTVMIVIGTSLVRGRRAALYRQGIPATSYTYL